MASLFEGTPQTASSYVESTSEYPKWMQDAIYNQITWAQNLAQTPYTPYEMPEVAELSPLEQQAYAGVQAQQGAWQPTMSSAITGTQGLTGADTATALDSAQNAYLNPAAAASLLSSGQTSLGNAAGMDVFGSASPYLSQASSATGQALSGSALDTANPYLSAAGQSSVSNIQDYMNPYQQNVLDVIAQQGARNLTENILPGVSDAFIKSGQFGSSQMGEMGSRAIRDTQEAVLQQQAQAAQAGYTQAAQLQQADLERQAQLAQTAGGLSKEDLARTLQAGAQYGTLGQTAGQLTAQQQQNLASIGQAQLAGGQAQQSLGLNAAQAVQAAQSQDYATRMSALQQLASLAAQEQQMAYTDTAALEAAGQGQRAVAQAQLDAAKAQYEQQQLYPWQQLAYAGEQIRGLSSTVPQTTSSATNSTGQTYSASPLSQLASGLSTAAGLAKSNLFG